MIVESLLKLDHWFPITSSDSSAIRYSIPDDVIVKISDIMHDGPDEFFNISFVKNGTIHTGEITKKNCTNPSYFSKVHAAAKLSEDKNLLWGDFLETSLE